jgi:FkbM family methyltransferase
MKSSLFRLYRAARCLRISKRPGVLAQLSRFSKLDLSILEPGKDRSRIYIKGTQVEATAAAHEFLLRGSEQLGRLLREAGAVLSPLPDGVLLEACGVKLKLQTWEEMFIATEVFCEGIYNLQTGRPFALIDIGMNVGTTSLFFARKDECRVVYAFEPFPKTVTKARINLALNPEVAKKIEVTGKGVAARQFRAELDYIEEYKGSLGRNGLPGYVRPDPASAHYEKVGVDFIPGSEVFTKVRGLHPDLALVCKLDCEGAEYEILQALAVAALLREVEYFMIEWHEKGPRPVEELLGTNGFGLLSFTPNAPNHGMIYAWRQPIAERGKPRA